MKYIIILFLSIFTITAYSEQKINSFIDNEWSNDRYIDHGNIVTDRKTKLMWKKCSEGQTGNSCSGDAASYTWKDALRVAESSIFAGYSDWRLPNLKELASLVALDRINPSINIDIFPNTASRRPFSYYWSSSPFSNNSLYSVGLSFDTGYDSPRNRSRSLHVRLVRSAQ